MNHAEMLRDQPLELSDAGDKAGALDPWNQAAALGSPRAVYQRGIVTKSDGDLVGASSWLL